MDSVLKNEAGAAAQNGQNGNNVKNNQSGKKFGKSDSRKRKVIYDVGGCTELPQFLDKATGKLQEKQWEVKFVQRGEEEVGDEVIETVSVVKIKAICPVPKGLGVVCIVKFTEYFNDTENKWLLSEKIVGVVTPPAAKK